MTKILFVCHGNICRSPMAEFIMKDLVSKAGISQNFEIASAATSTEELYNPVYPPAKRKLLEHGISCEGKRARQITAKDFDYYDMIIIMDENNLRNIHRMFGNKFDSKISMMMDYTNRKGSVSDPWYSGNFEVTWQDIFDGCSGLIEKLKNV